jgi:hypothetical protein
MPPDRDIEFVIELLPGMTPICKSPYRMSTLQLMELKAILESLKERGISILAHRRGEPRSYLSLKRWHP